MLILSMATVNAVDSNYPYVDKSPTILNQDVFKQAFSVDGVDRVAYNYQLTPLDGGMEASVAFQMKLVIDGVSYTTSAVGTVGAYELPESDILWEGPIDGEITINDIPFNIIIGFMQRASTQEVMVSVTLQNDDYDFMVISFGKNIMTGDVLDCINQRFGTPSSSEIVSDANGVQSGQLNINDGGNASTNAFDSDKTVIMHPGDTGTTAPIFLGENNEWVFQSNSVRSHGSTSYHIVESRVYFDNSRNQLMIQIKPYSKETKNYLTTVGYSAVGVSLVLLDVELELSDVEAANYATIQGFLPSSEFRESFYNKSAQALHPLFADLASLAGIPTDLFASYLEDLKGKVTKYEDPLNSKITIDMPLGISGTTSNLDEITNGLGFRFQLLKNSNSSAYVGNTPYTFTTNIKYFVLAQINVPLSTPVTTRFYIEESTTNNGTVTLQ